MLIATPHFSFCQICQIPHVYISGDLEWNIARFSFMFYLKKIKRDLFSFEQASRSPILNQLATAALPVVLDKNGMLEYHRIKVKRIM